MDISKKKVFVFDYDGVVANSVNIKTEAFHDLYLPYGKEIAQKAVEHHLEHGGISRFEKFKFCHNKFLKKKITKLELDVLSDKFSKLVTDKVVSCELIKGVKDFLKNLKKRNKLCAINTGTPTQEILEITSRNGLDIYFDFTLGSPSTKTQNLDILHQQSGLDYDLFVFFGDSLTDIQAAKELDIDFIGVGNEIKKYKALHLRSSFVKDFRSPFFNNLLSLQK